MTYRRARRVLFSFLVFGLGFGRVASAQGVSVRIIPPQRAQFLQFQRFDLRVEATADSAATISDLAVLLDGRDITAAGVVQNPSPNVRNWILRSAYLGNPGLRTIDAIAHGSSGGSAVSGSGQSLITVREWLSRTQPLSLTPQAAAPSGRALDDGRAFASLGSKVAASDDVMNRLHLGATSPLFHREAELAGEVRRAKNVILFIGDGMGIAHRTAARVLSRGYTQGKANGTLAIDRLPYNGWLMTSSLDSLITDSAPGAHNYSTGNKTNNGMEGVFPDNTTAEDDNPRIENLPEWLTRNFGKVTGVVSDAFITDATPAAMIAHTQNRGNGTLIASQYVDSAYQTNLKVLMGGGAYYFIPMSQTGSRRTDERNVINDFRAAGFAFVENRTQLNDFRAPSVGGKLLGLFNLDNMNVAYDKLKLGDPTVVSAFPDQPFLDEMTRAAIDVLRTYPEGFFLMVEGAHIDKQSHAMDAERSIYDVIQLDKAVAVALQFAFETNADNDPNNDTLVIVTADHECAGLTLPGVGRPEKAGTRDYVKTYQYRAPRNDSTTLNFPEYVDENHDGYPDNPAVAKKLIMSFGANSDRYEDWKPRSRPRAPNVRDGNGVTVANPAENTAGSMLITGVIEDGIAGGESDQSAVHTLTDIPISAYGPGASQFARVVDNTEAFFFIVNAYLGLYPTPIQY